MSTEYFVAMDTHVSFCDLAVVSKHGKLVQRERCETTIPALVKALETVRRPRRLTFEEGPLADWLARNLREHVDELVVCDPRRNQLIAKEGDKDDPIDAEKLAHLYRGGYLKEVHQVHSLERSLLKQYVSFYHHRVRERVRQGNQLVALLRRHGVFVRVGDLADPEEREALYRRLGPKWLLWSNLESLLEVYDLLGFQEEEIRAELVRRARLEEPVGRFAEVPGIAWIRGVTFYVYLDTPWRFRCKAGLWRYCGIGLKRRHSGQGPRNSQLDHQGHRHLKNVLLGAAKSAIASVDSPFADKYRYWTQEEGVHPSTARRNVARGLATLLWSLWKSGGRYDPAAVRGVGCRAAVAP
jgi:transposase